MEIVDKYNEGSKLNVGDLIILKNSQRTYIGTKRLVCVNSVAGSYRLIALDTNTIIYQEYHSLEDIYNDYEEDIEKIIPAGNLKLILQ